MPSQTELRRQITDQIVEALERGGVPPWRRPWSLGANAGPPANVVSRQNYRGLNPVLLDLAAARHGFSSRWWGTFHQWRRLGGRVMPRPLLVPPGKWGTQICYWSPVTKTVQGEQGDDEEDRFFVLKLYTVFNVDQVAGLDRLRAGHFEAAQPVEFDHGPAEEALEAARVGMGISIRFGGGRAFYSPGGEYIQLPPKASFDSAGEFYATAFHEMTHATEHPSRLDWSRKGREHAYALGELIAELGGVYVCRELGVPTGDTANHTAYLGHWLQAMKSDARFIFTAAGQASKAADYILSFSRRAEAEAAEPEGEPATA